MFNTWSWRETDKKNERKGGGEEREAGKSGQNRYDRGRWIFRSKVKLSNKKEKKESGTTV